jgi:predicted ester cyclase
MTRSEIVALLEQHRDGFRCRDAAALATGHTENGTFDSPAHGLLEGRPKILAVYEYWFAAFPDLTLTWGDPLIDGDHAAIFWEFSGTSRGPFFGIVGANTPVEMHGAAEIHVADGGIKSIRHVFDFSSVLVRTGVLKVRPS